MSFSCLNQPLPTQLTAPTTSTHALGAKLLGHVPVAFVPNMGQWEHDASYVARFGAMTVFLQDNGWTFTLIERGHGATESMRPMGARAHGGREPKPMQGRGVAVRMSFVGASSPELAAQHQLPGRHNYFLGNTPSKWRSDVPLYGSVCYRQLYSGVDVCVREHDGHLEYDLMLQPEAPLESRAWYWALNGGSTVWARAGDANRRIAREWGSCIGSLDRMGRESSSHRAASRERCRRGVQGRSSIDPHRADLPQCSTWPARTAAS